MARHGTRARARHGTARHGMEWHPRAPECGHGARTASHAGIARVRHGTRAPSLALLRAARVCRVAETER
eukprot:5753168-Pyramimonas_sp.AAC.1